MKTIFLYDTETSGFPLWSQPSEHPDQPRITQIAAELCIEETGETLASMNMLIKPDGWTIPEELQLLTGITMERAEKFGFPIEIALEAFIRMWEMADIRCAHNESFDMRMVRIELMKSPKYSQMKGGSGESSFADDWKAAPAFCTQGQSTTICNLPPTEKMLAAKRKGPKSPTLKEAYLHFTGKRLDGAHNAMIDVQGCKAVYFGIRRVQQELAAING